MNTAEVSVSQSGEGEIYRTLQELKEIAAEEEKLIASLRERLAPITSRQAISKDREGPIDNAAASPLGEEMLGLSQQARLNLNTLYGLRDALEV